MCPSRGDRIRGLPPLPPAGPGTTGTPLGADTEKAADLYSLGLIAFNAGNLDVSLDYINQALALSGVDGPTKAQDAPPAGGDLYRPGEVRSCPDGNRADHRRVTRFERTPIS